MHRYDVMHDVRAAYAKEADAEVAAGLVDILEKVDPEQIIEGRGIIPRKPKVEGPPDDEEVEEEGDEEEDDESDDEE
jgi:hypothetical protein